MPLWPQRWLRFMAKSELYWWPLTLVLNAAGAFPVRRGRADVEAIETAVRLAREGNVVVMFPEGTRRGRGCGRSARRGRARGAARIALEAGVPLVPAAIKGTDRLLAARAAAGRLRRADRRRRPARGGDRAGAQEATERLMARIDGAGGDAVSAAARGRRRLLRAPRVPRAAEVDPRCNARRRLHEHARPAVGGGAPRAVLVAWDTLEVPTYRHEAFAAYQSGRVFDDVAARAARAAARARARRSASPSRRRRATRRTTSSRPRRARRAAADVARGDLRPRRVPARERARDDPAADARRERARADRSGRGARALRRRAGAGAGLHRAARRSVRQAARARAASARRRRPSSCASTARSRRRSTAGRFAAEADDLRLYRRIATMDASAPLPPLADTPRLGGGGRASARGLGLGGGRRRGSRARSTS